MTTSRIGTVEPEQPPDGEKVVSLQAEQALPAGLQRDEDFWRIWRQRLLPFMAAMTAAFAVFFLIATAVQLYQLQERVDSGPKLNVSNVFEAAAPAAIGVSDSERLRWHALAALEGHALALRYHQANVLLISRVWTSYLGFLTGIILALIGAVFVLGRLESQDSTLEISGSGWNGLFKSNAPGLMLAVLGTVLMITTLTTHNQIDVRDGPQYALGLMPPSVATALQHQPQRWPVAGQDGVEGASPDGISLNDAELEQEMREHLQMQAIEAGADTP